MNRLELEKTTVLGGLVYFQSVRQQYIKLVPPLEKILDQQRSAYHSMESCLSVLIRADQSVKPEYLMKMLAQQYNRLSPAATELRKDYGNIFEQLDNSSMYTEDLCMKLLNETVKAKAVRELQEAVTQPGGTDNVTKAIGVFEETVRGIRRNPNDEIRIWRPLDDIEELMVNKPRTPTGVSIIDKILDGGIAVGEHMGILGPSGGGKSICANMLQCNFAIRKYNTLLIQTEQLIEGDISSRMYAYMTGTQTSAFVGKSYDAVDPKLIQRIRELKPIWDRMRCISVADKVAKTNRATTEVLELIQSVIDSGFTPNFIILDWLGKMVTQFMRGNDDKKFQDKAEELKGDINAYARAHGISVIYLHQTDTQSQHREPAYKPGRNDAHNYRSFANDLESCICMGTATRFDNGLQVAWMGTDKARMMQTGKYVMAKIDGSRARITECEEGEYALNSKGQFQPMRELLGVGKQPKNAPTIYVPPAGSADDFLKEAY